MFATYATRAVVPALLPINARTPTVVVVTFEVILPEKTPSI